jgi:hypothetical protein
MTGKKKPKTNVGPEYAPIWHLYELKDTSLNDSFKMA